MRLCIAVTRNVLRTSPGTTSALLDARNVYAVGPPNAPSAAITDGHNVTAASRPRFSTPSSLANRTPLTSPIVCKRKVVPMVVASRRLCGEWRPVPSASGTTTDESIGRHQNRHSALVVSLEESRFSPLASFGRIRLNRLSIKPTIVRAVPVFRDDPAPLGIGDDLGRVIG